MKEQSVVSKNYYKKYNAVEGGLSVPVKGLHNHPIVTKKLEEMKTILKKYPIPMELFKAK